jgi:hypothetical protein
VAKSGNLKKNSEPINVFNHFFGHILLKLAENVQNGKTGITLFLMNINRDTALNDFQDFFNGAFFYFSNLTRFLGDLA